MIEAELDGPDGNGAVGRIVLSRPEAHNALDRAGIAALDAVLADWEDREALRVVVLTGRGRSFCAGAALGEVAGGSFGGANPLGALCDRLDAFPVPVVAALNGGVYGGGVDLALACDFRVGVEGMRAFVPPARLGIHYEPAGIARAVDRLGSQVARRMFLRAESFDAAALLAAGFVDELVAPDRLSARAEEIAAEIAGLAPLAVRGMKRTLREIVAGTLDADAARARIAACFASEDHAEGLAAQREKRAPRFLGR
ncbi:MAG: enoyl-CoA hydratase/isomerase family protein [Amaricoccus sp.]|uniref:enoyl-CoA hydratase/isomerase family protein n=1 Tax=Amaricoccus sp. TaxID=1872485 RepID=UPI0039E2977D